MPGILAVDICLRDTAKIVTGFCFCWSLLKNTAVIVVTVYMSIAVRNNMHFILYRYCCKGRYSVNIHLKCLETSGNLIMTGLSRKSVVSESCVFLTLCLGQQQCLEA